MYLLVETSTFSSEKFVETALLSGESPNRGGETRCKDLWWQMQRCATGISVDAAVGYN